MKQNFWLLLKEDNIKMTLLQKKKEMREKVFDRPCFNPKQW